MLPRLFQSLNGVLILIMAAGVGYFLVTVPGTVIEYYDKAAAHSALIAYLYIASVSLGMLILACQVRATKATHGLERRGLLCRPSL